MSKWFGDGAACPVRSRALAPLLVQGADPPLASLRCGNLISTTTSQRAHKALSDARRGPSAAVDRAGGSGRADPVAHQCRNPHHGSTDRGPDTVVAAERSRPRRGCPCACQRLRTSDLLHPIQVFRGRAERRHLKRVHGVPPHPNRASTAQTSRRREAPTGGAAGQAGQQKVEPSRKQAHRRFGWVSRPVGGPGDVGDRPGPQRCAAANQAHLGQRFKLLAQLAGCVVVSIASPGRAVIAASRSTSFTMRTSDRLAIARSG